MFSEDINNVAIF